MLPPLDMLPFMFLFMADMLPFMLDMLPFMVDMLLFMVELVVVLEFMLVPMLALVVLIVTLALLIVTFALAFPFMFALSVGVQAVQKLATVSRARSAKILRIEFPPETLVGSDCWGAARTVRTVSARTCVLAAQGLWFKFQPGHSLPLPLA